MKIGLLTYYGDLNCGTNLQAYATLLAIKKAYPNDDVEIVPFHGFRLRMMPYKTFSLIDMYHDVWRFKKYAAFKKEQLRVYQDCIITDVDKALRYIADRKYDVIYVGADTLLELDRLPKGYDGISAYWLKDIHAKKILIAASSKNVSYEQLTSRQKAELKIAASQFAYIGVRDRATMSLFEILLGNDKRIVYVPDPTFTYDIDYSYIDAYLKHRKINIPKMSVFIQFYGDDKWLDVEVKKLKQQGFVIVTNRGVSWSDIVLIDMSPLEQIGLYKYVSFVVTPRFHDGVFCMINHTPVLIYVKSGKVMITGGDSKHISLLKDFRLYPQAYLGALDSGVPLKNIWNSYNEVMECYDGKYVDDMLKENRQVYLDYLNTTLKG